MIDLTVDEEKKKLLQVKRRVLEAGEKFVLLKQYMELLGQMKRAEAEGLFDLDTGLEGILQAQIEDVKARLGFGSSKAKGKGPCGGCIVIIIILVAPARQAAWARVGPSAATRLAGGPISTDRPAPAPAGATVPMNGIISTNIMYRSRAMAAIKERTVATYFLATNYDREATWRVVICVKWGAVITDATYM